MTQAAFTNEVNASGPLQGLLIRERVAVSVKVSSKKRMLEELAELLSRQLPGMDQHTVFSTLTERERLGFAATVAEAQHAAGRDATLDPALQQSSHPAPTLQAAEAAVKVL